MNWSSILKPWKRLLEAAFPSLEQAVTQAAARHFSEFGYVGMSKHFTGFQYAVQLQHCEVHFWYYKSDLGSAIRPLSPDPEVRYASKQVDERTVPYSQMTNEVDRQAEQIASRYRSVLLGEFGDWPTEDQ